MTCVRSPAPAKLAGLILLLSMLMASQVSAVNISLERPVVEQLSRAEFEAAAGLPTACCDDITELTQPGAEAVDVDTRYSLDTLFSAQAGSWIFESLVHNGLLRIASRYQPTHPRALTLHKGNSSLAGLTRKLRNASILELKGQDEAGRPIYHLHYPLIIGHNATLTVENAVLMLDASAAAVIVNAGSLSVIDAEITTLQAELKGGTRFRPFILGWNGSRTYLERARLHRLGYNAYLSSGLTLGHHASLQRRGSSSLQMADSVLERMEAGLTSDQAKVRISTTVIEDSARYGIDFSAGDLQLANSRIERTRYNAGVRIRNGGHIRLRDNLISATHRDAVRIEGSVSSLSIINNFLAGSGGDGIRFQEVRADNGPLILEKNRIRNSARSGINSHHSGPLLARGNDVVGNEHYALRAVFAEQSSSQPLWLQDNVFANSGEASISTSGGAILGLSGNEFRARYVVQPVIRGQLATTQTQILKSSKTPDQAIQIRQATFHPAQHQRE
ncbi:right-handed parallel beta-helix repeat-containing protein [Allohahella marinimesophila]|uniref:Right handed beta helix domain-containing protein n=1 Tax=Allohahella marinimesophila TaxID=1054972 RepID=A0ABP7PLF9_9GAMM